MSKSKSTKKFPYDELHLYVAKERKYRRWWVVISVILGLLFFFNRTEDLELLVILGMALSCIIVVILLATENFDRSNNRKYIHQIIGEFHSKQYIFTTVEIDNIAQRATVGNNSGPMRTLLHVLIIPLLVSLFVSLVISDSIQFLGWQELNITNIGPIFAVLFLVMSIVLSFLFELDRANTDVVILHAISEYRKQRKYAQVVERKTETDEITLRAIVETKKKRPHIQANEKRTSAEVSRLIRIHGIPANQRSSQRSVASTNGVRGNDEANQRSNSKQ